jgi:uncharacterized membrane protein YjgN (DUF898 family)
VNQQRGFTQAIQIGALLVSGPLVFFIIAAQVGKKIDALPASLLLALILSLIWMIAQSLRLMKKDSQK